MSILATNSGGQGAAVAVIVALLIVIALIAMNAFGKPKRPRYRRPFKVLRFDRRQRNDLTDVGYQLNAVIAGTFEKQKVMSSSEYRVFAIVENEFATSRKGYRVFAQTSLGEILRSSDRDAFHSINSKRVDILVIDHRGWPYLAVEFQGNGHYQGNAAGRDAVKKEALRKAGVRYLEFSAADTDDQIRTRVRDHLAAQTVTPEVVESGPWQHRAPRA